MKRKIHYIFFIIFIFSCNYINLRDNDETFPMTEYWNVNLFDNEEKIFTDIYSGFSLKQKLDSLPKKEYTFEFISIFNDTLIKNIVVDSSFVLPSDLNDYYELDKINSDILNNLSEQDTISFFYESAGCFKFDRILYKIYAQDEILKVAKYENGLLVPLEISNSKQKLKKLIQQGKKYNNQFGCTTIDLYFFKLQNKVFTIADGSCNWNGINILLKD